jgi:hypothetical protein
MNLDELTQEIRAVSTDPAVQGLADQLAAWKSSSATADELATTLERYLGNVWIASNQEYDRVYALWSDFRNSAITPIRGMTMNERLHWFGMFERFDSLQSDADRQAVYRKLHAGVA